MRVLVTGGAGYIGSHTCKVLASYGYEPVVFDNLSRGHRHNVKWGPFIEGDLLDRASLIRAFEEYRPSAAVHFAALAYVGESVQNPLSYYRNNFCGSLNLVETMTDFECPSLVFSSTCAVYGLSDGDAIQEHHPKNPINPYGHSKRMVEQLLEDCANVHGLRSVSLRYFNAAGAHPDGDLTEEHEPETHIIPLVLQTAAGLRDAIEVYGTDYPTPDGTAVRDYIHVCDLAEAHVAALRYLEGGGATTAVNLGTGNGHSVLAVVGAVERVTGLPVEVRTAGRRPGDPPVLVAKAESAARVLNWTPRYVDLDETVRTAWRSMPVSREFVQSA
jgi:UDP-glucose-4-epimerase GalE